MAAAGEIAGHLSSDTAEPRAIAASKFEESSDAANVTLPLPIVSQSLGDPFSSSLLYSQQTRPRVRRGNRLRKRAAAAARDASCRRNHTLPIGGQTSTRSSSCPDSQMPRIYKVIVDLLWPDVCTPKAQGVFHVFWSRQIRVRPYPCSLRVNFRSSAASAVTAPQTGTILGTVLDVTGSTVPNATS